MVFPAWQDPSCDSGAESVPDVLLRSQGSRGEGPGAMLGLLPSDRLSQISGRWCPGSG